MKKIPALWAALLLVPFASPAAAQDRHPVTAEDGRLIQGIGATAVSPDGHWAVFVRTTLSKDEAKTDRSLWLVDLTTPGATPRPLTDGKSDGQPVWSPDSANIAFVRPGPDGAQIFVHSLATGKDVQVTWLARGAGNPAWSPDGRAIAFTSSTIPGGTEPAGPALKYDAKVILRANFRFAGRGVIDFAHPDQLWIVPVPTGSATPEPRRLTRNAYSAGAPSWSRDGRRIYFGANPVAEPYYGGSQPALYAVDVANGAITTLKSFRSALSDTFMNEPAKSVVSPDGRRIAFVNSDPALAQGFAQQDVILLDLATGAVRNLTATYDSEIEDQLAWRDNGHLLALASWQAATNLVEIDTATGKVKPLSRGQRQILDFSASADGRRIVVKSTGRAAPAELFTIDATGEHRLTDFNAALTAKWSMEPLEDIRFTTADGKEIHGFLQKPQGFDPARKYPLILWIHGGPNAFFSYGFNIVPQLLAGAGYAVLYVNPRGSTSYGQKFATAEWPGKDYDDLMAAVDLVAARPYIDASKLGVAGASAGGMMTDWAISHSTRFTAAVSISDIADFDAMWFQSDQPNLTPRSPPPFVAGHSAAGISPITYSDRIRTPTMFIAGEDDFRTPPTVGGQSLFRVLRFYHVPTALILFPGEGHSIASPGLPWHLVQRNNHMLAWFDKYLKGAAKPEYDVAAANVCGHATGAAQTCSAGQQSE